MLPERRDEWCKICSKFQEIIQAKGYSSPIYKVLESLGPDHKKTFKSAVFISEKKYTLGVGNSKQEAEQEAAKKGLEKLKKKE